MSYDLDYVEAYRKTFGTDECLVLNDKRDSNKESTICAWRAALRGSEDSDAFLGNWILQINEFRDECRKERLITDPDAEVEKLEDIADMEERKDVGEHDVGDKKEEEDSLVKLRQAVSVNFISN